MSLYLVYLIYAAVAVAFVFGGMRFRNWAVEERLGIPRFSHHTETIMLWLVYSSTIAFVVFWVRQVLHEIG